MTFFSDRSHRLALLAFSAGIFCIQLDAFALNLALLSIAQDYAVPVGRLKWVVSGYLLSVGIFMLAAGRLSDGFGHGRLLRLGLALFGSASLLCVVVVRRGPVAALAGGCQGASRHWRCVHHALGVGAVEPSVSE